MNLVQKPLVMVMMLMMSLMMLMTLMMFTMTSMLYLYCAPICVSPRYLHDDRMISDTMLLEHWMECIMARPLGCCCVTEIVLRGQPAVCSMSFVPPRAGYPHCFQWKETGFGAKAGVPEFAICFHRDGAVQFGPEFLSAPNWCPCCSFLPTGPQMDIVWFSNFLGSATTIH